MIIAMSEKVSVLLSDVTIKGDVVEKEKLVTDSKIDGDITSENLVTHQGSKINGNISASSVTLGGVSKGNISSDKINIKSTAEVEGVLNQKNLSIEEGAKLKIKAETY
jgi:cytoskeletal protein CcmA (bactofilin family)